MPRAKRTRKEADLDDEIAATMHVAKHSTPPETSDTTPSNKRTKRATTKTAKDEKEKVAPTSDSSQGLEIDYICVCPPAEYHPSQTNTDDDDEEDEKSEACGGPKCVCNKRATELPDHIWILTRAGFELFVRWRKQQEKRNQHNFGMYFYNDFTGYGTREVMENMLLAFDEEVKNEAPDPLMLWSHVEAIAWFLNGDLFQWYMSDDSKGNAEIVAMFGVAILTTIESLIKHHLFSKSSKLRNTGIVSTQLLHFIGADGQELCLEHEHGWITPMVRFADEHGIEIKGRPGIELDALRAREGLDDDEEFFDDEEEEDETPSTNKTAWKPEDDFNGEGARMWKQWDWTKEFVRFCDGHGEGTSGIIGGDHHDLAAEFKRARHMIEHELGGGMESDNGEVDVDSESMSSWDEETVSSEDSIERTLK